MPIQLLVRDAPTRSISIANAENALIFSHGHASGKPSSSPTSSPECTVEIQPIQNAELEDYRRLPNQPILGVLGLLALGKDVFICVIKNARKVAVVRPGETIEKILHVEFHCLNSSEYDRFASDDAYMYTTDSASEDGSDYDSEFRRRDPGLEHPCLMLKKLLNDGTFYFSSDFDVTSRLQDRSSGLPDITLDNLHKGFLWNAYMIEPLVGFRKRLSQQDKEALDSSGFLISVFRGFAQTTDVPPSSVPQNEAFTDSPAHLTLISRLSSQRAGTRFNARGIDDDGNVANFVETETFFGTASGVSFSYVQTRGSVPVFWEQATGLLPGQQRITITRSCEAAQPAFDKHFEELEIKYGAVHIVNLLSNEKPAEAELSARFDYHTSRSSLNNRIVDKSAPRTLLKQTYYDFHAETRGSAGLEAVRGICRYIQDSANSFAYFLADDSRARVTGKGVKSNNPHQDRNCNVILRQEGVFRTNCLDCLDRTNLVQTIINQIALISFIEHGGHLASPDFWNRHSTLWADNGDALSRIYAGTGAIKSSFTRHGKMSLAGALADARKSATRLYVNNFADKGRQNTIDILLGRLVGQSLVHLCDPMNDYINSEMAKRAGEYISSRTLHLWTGTLNLNGRSQGLSEDLSLWLFPLVERQSALPDIFVIAFQEIVELSPQQIMSTDPAVRQAWEEAVKAALNSNGNHEAGDEYVLIQGSQLVGTSLSVFVKTTELKNIKNVEGSLKKTGMSGIAGNKGAVAIRMDFANTSICFVTAHLAAGFSNFDDRNRDYSTISHGLRFQRNRSIDDHDTVIWLGDFNYRIELSNDRVRKLIEMGDLGTLHEYDQLYIQMRSGTAFATYEEAPITFRPTYKYDIGSDRYDTSEKARVPAWTDRIVHKGRNLIQSSYSTAPLRISDHRPVYATFDCNVLVIDEEARDTLSQSLYRERRAALGYKTAASAKVSPLPNHTKEQPLIPSLSPISSAKEKFWNGDGDVKGNYVPHTADNTAAISRKPPISTKQTARPDLAYRVPGKGSSTTASTTTSEQASGISGKPFVPPARRSAATAVARSNSTVRNTSSSTPPPIQPLRRSSTDVNASLEQQQQQQQQQSGSKSILPEPQSNQIFSGKPAPRVPQKPSALSSLNSSSSFPTTTSTNENITSSTSSSPSPSLSSSTRTPPSSDSQTMSSSVRRTPSLPTKPVLLPGLAPSPGLPPAGRAAFLAMQKHNKGSNNTGNTGSAIGRSSASASTSTSTSSISSSNAAGGGGGGGGGKASNRNAITTTSHRQGSNESKLAAQRSVHLQIEKKDMRNEEGGQGKGGEKSAQVSQKKAAAVTTTAGLMDEDVGNGLQEVDKWKALEPGMK